MLLWRISNHATLDGSGGLYAAGRWHTRGRPILYTSQNPSTALLEVLVHLEIDPEDRPANFRLLKIEAPETISRQTLDPTRLDPAWQENLEDQSLTQAIGDAWLAHARTLLLEVPSVLVPETWNILINPLHPQASLLRIVSVYDHPFDPRLE
jgi:RES domain-containing protein